MALLQMMQPQQQSGMDTDQLMKLLSMAAMASGVPAAGAAGAAPAAAATGASAVAMPAIQGASAMPAAATMGPPTQLQGLLNQPTAAAQLGVPAGLSSPASPSASLMPPAYNRPAAPMPQQQWTDASIAAQEAAIQSESDAAQTGSMQGRKPDYQKAAGLLGQMNKQMTDQGGTPQMQPLSRGQAAPMQEAASPLTNFGGGYREMLMKLAQGRYG